jgi:hypothetical protein
MSTLTDEQLRTLSKLPKSSKVLVSTANGPIVSVTRYAQTRTYLVNRGGFLISPRGTVRDALLAQREHSTA